MNHLTQQQLFALVDGQLDDAEERTYNAHLASCARCRNEVTLQRSLGTVARRLPLEKPSPRFTERTMKRIFRVGTQPLSYKILQNVASAAAMIAVLVVLGYILSSPSELLVSADDSTSSELFTVWKTFYSNVKSLLSSTSLQFSKTLTAHASTPVSKIISVTVLVLIGLAALDRFVLQKIVRMKM